MHWGQVNLHHFGAKGTALAAGTLEVTADSVDHALGRGLAEHIGCSVGIHKDIHERLKCLDLAARLGDARLMTICAGTGAPMPAIALNITGAAGFTTAT